MLLQRLASLGPANLGIASVSDSLALFGAGGQSFVLMGQKTANQASSLPIAIAFPSYPSSPLLVEDSPGPQMAFQITSTLPRAYISTAFSAPLSFVNIAADGTLSAPVLVNSNIGRLWNVEVIRVIDLGTTDLALLASRAVTGLSLFNVSDSGGFTQTASITDGPKTYLQEVTTMAEVTVSGNRYVLAASALDEGVTLLRINPDGSTTFSDAIGMKEGLYVSAPTDLEIMSLSGRSFAVLAAAGSDSLSVLRINPMGVLFVEDHVLDSGLSRFANVGAIDSFTIGNRQFVIAGGSDAGFTIFELLPSGKLAYHSSTSFETGAGLLPVTGIEAQPTATTVEILATTTGGTAIERFSIPTTTLGSRLDALPGGGSLAGTGLDERLVGGAGADSLSGAGGADFLHDGGGADTLVGGAGADVFVFASDGQTDRISDFQKGSDLLDVSDWGRIYSAASLSYTPTANGIEIAYGSERLIITSDTGLPLSGASFTDADFIFI